MNLTLNNKEYEVEVIRKNNKNTYIRIKEGKILITTSYFTSNNTLKKIIEQNQKSIQKMIEKKEKQETRKEYFYLLGVPYKIIIKEEKIAIDKTKKIVITPSLEELESKIKKESLTIYKSHLEQYYHNFHESIPYPKLKIRKMTSRWGVCNTKTNTITLNLELMHYELDCLDYVIVHELSHLIVPNHSKDFWNIVSKYYPNYKEIRKKLRNEC